MTSPSPNRRRSVIRSFRMVLIAAAGAAVWAAGCEESAPPPGPTAGSGAPVGAPPSRPQSNAPGSTGPLSRLTDQPTSLLGRTAHSGKQVGQQMADRDTAMSGMVDEMSGQAAPLEVGGLRWSVPSEWTRSTNPGPMRAAEFRIPHPEGGEGEAVAVWFHFPGGQGGSVEDNIRRWSEQVRNAWNEPGEPAVKRRTINGVSTTTVELEGTYRDGLPGQPYVERPDYVFRGAIAEGPNGLVFFRLVGPRDIVYAVFHQWDQVVGSTRRAGM
mgnify:CR=1 FL=1|jgi:hypothetical protein